MPEEKTAEIWQAQEWIRTAPIDDVREFLGWAKAILEMRAEMQPKRKTRSDAGQSRKAEAEQKGAYGASVDASVKEKDPK